MRSIVTVVVLAWTGAAWCQQAAPPGAPALSPGAAAPSSPRAAASAAVHSADATRARSSAAASAAAARAAEVEALEPAVDVGGRAPSSTTSASRSSTGAASSSSGASAASSSATAASSSSAANAAARARTRPAAEHVDLGTTSITGNQELPKVLYIVPWKRSDLGELVGRPVNTLLDEVLAPVDRDVFKRHLEYYDELFNAAPADTSAGDKRKE